MTTTTTIDLAVFAQPRLRVDPHETVQDRLRAMIVNLDAERRELEEAGTFLTLRLNDISVRRLLLSQALGESA